MTTYKTGISKPELVTILKTLEAEGHSLKSAEVTANIYRAAKVYYGSWKNVINELELKQHANKLTQVRRKLTDEEIKSTLTEYLSLGYTKKDILNKDRRIYDAILRNFGSIEHFACTNGIDLSAYPNFKYKKNYRKLEKESFTSEQTLSKEEVDVYLKRILHEYSQGDKINYDSVFKDNRKMLESIKTIYGSLAKAICSSGEYVLDLEAPKLWSKDFLLTQIRLGYELEAPLNTEYITKFAPSAEEYARRAFGSWKNAVLLAGIPNSYFELDSQVSARAGHVFEEVLGEILQCLGFEYSKYTHEKYKPDFVCGNHWIDAKLSLWTLSKHEKGTVGKYEPHCDKLTIVFLRGDKLYDNMITDKTRVVSVYVLLSKLTASLKDYYTIKLEAILDALKENAA